MQIDDLERIALATMFQYADLLEDTSEVIVGEDFFDPQNRTIAEAILTMRLEGIDIGKVSLFNFLKRKNLINLIDVSYIDELPRYAEPSAQVFADFKEFSIANRVNKIAMDYYHRSRDRTVGGRELLLSFLKDLETLDNMGGSGRQEIFKLRDSVNEAVDNVINKHLRNNLLAPSGWQAFDIQTGGRQAGELLVVGARPEVGKSTVASQMAYYDASHGIPAAIFTLEMRHSQYSRRNVSQEMGIKATSFRTAKLTPADVIEIKHSGLFDVPLFIVQPSDTSEKHLFSLMRRLIAMGVRSFYWDYLQLINFEDRKGASKDERIGNFTRKLKTETLNHGLFTTLFSSFNRDIEKRTGLRRPQLADLKASGDIEADADMVWALDRPELYILDKEVDKEGEFIKGRTDFIRLKSRDVNFKDFSLWWDPHYEKLIDKPKQEVTITYDPGVAF